jgi:hypothetical protein
MAAYAFYLRIRDDPAIKELVGWLTAYQEVQVSADTLDEEGVRHLSVDCPISLIDDTEHAISAWNVKHPGLLIVPE